MRSEWEVREERRRQGRKWRRSRRERNEASRLARVKCKDLPLDARSSFTEVARNWKQPRCPQQAHGCTWFIQSTDYYSAQKRNELSRRGQAWRNLQCISRSESSQTERAIDCEAKRMTFWKKGDYIDSRKISGCRGLGEGRREG